LENEALNKNIGCWEMTFVGYHILHLSVLNLASLPGTNTFVQSKIFSVFVFSVLVFVSFKCGWFGICSLW